MNTEEMREEAVQRMKAAGFPQPIIANFEDGKLVASGEEGDLRPLSELEQQAIDEFEEDTSGLVYHVVVTESNEFGTMVSLLFVSRHKQDWKVESGSLMEYRPLAYVHNIESPILSDFGTIGIQIEGDHFVRTF